MKTITSLLCLMILASALKAQKLVNDSTLMINDSLQIQIYDQILVNVPHSYEFVSIEEHKRHNVSLSNLGKVGLAAGATIGLAGVSSENLGIVHGGIKVISGSSILSGAGLTQEAINEMKVSKNAKYIIGKTLRIVSFEKKGSKKDGYAYEVITNVPGEKKRYKIDIAQALRLNEIIIL